MAAISSYFVSRARAVVVREYLIERFHLEPNATGAMPLGGESADTPPAEPWNGIALAFFMKSRT